MTHYGAECAGSTMRIVRTHFSTLASRSMKIAQSASYGSRPRGPGSVLVLEVEVGTANGSGQLRLLPRELELRGELRGDFHPVGELEPDRPLPGVIDGVHHVDGQAALVEDIGHPDVLDLEGRCLQRARRDDDVAFLPEDPVHPVDGRCGVARRLHREDVAVLVLEVAGL